MKKFILLSFVLAAFTFTGCKYEDGPSLSLKSKKSRLAGEYTAEKVLRNGEELDISYLDGFLYIFDKDGNATVKTTNFETKATYEFGDKKETLIVTDENGAKEERTILRLASKEFWYTVTDGDVVTEVHLAE